MYVQVFVRLVVSGLQLHRAQLIFGVLLENVVDLLSADLCCRCRDAKIDAWRFVSTAAEEGHCINKNAAGLSPDAPLLNLGAFDPCERKQIAAHVVEDLNSVPIECVDFVAKFEQRQYWVGVRLA